MWPCVTLGINGELCLCSMRILYNLIAYLIEFFFITFDLFITKKIVTFGEIMLRLAAPGYMRFSQASHLVSTFGGGEANVAVSLANYGIPVDFITRLPVNDIGRWCEKEIRKHGVYTKNIVLGGERLGIYFLETGAVSRGSNVIYDRAYSAVSEIRQGMIDWEEVF